MAAESYWMYAADPRQQQQQQQLQAATMGMAAPAAWQQQQPGVHHGAAGPVVAARAAAPPQAAHAMAPPPPLPAGPPPLKRQRPDYFDMPSGQERAGFHESMGASYGGHLYNEMPYVGASQTARPLGGMAAYPVDNHQMMGYMGLDSRNMDPARNDPVLPHDASNILYVECLPSNVTRREVSHIFRPFPGFREVRLVNKESRNPGRYHVLCFVDFVTPSHAFVALERLQGYKFDEHDHQSSNLRLQFANSPGSRSGGGPRGRH